MSIRVVGRSDPWGFTLTGNVSQEEVLSAANEALARLQAGESVLAVHPRCGTNIVTGALLASLFSLAAMGGRTRHRWERLPRVILATMSALLVAQPLGLWAQQHITTASQLDGAYIENISSQEKGRLFSHRLRVGHI